MPAHFINIFQHSRSYGFVDIESFIKNNFPHPSYKGFNGLEITLFPLRILRVLCVTYEIQITRHPAMETMKLKYPLSIFFSEPEKKMGLFPSFS